LRRILFSDDSLHKKSCTEPGGSVVKADKSVDVQLGVGVIPGAHIGGTKQQTGEIFDSEYKDCVDTSSKKCIPIFD